MKTEHKTAPKRISRPAGNTPEIRLPYSVFALLSSPFCPASPSCRSTRVESPLQIGVVTQNKPNSQNHKTTATYCTTKIYANIPPRPAPKNKPNQTQFRPPPPVHEKSPATKIFHGSSAPNFPRNNGMTKGCYHNKIRIVSFVAKFSLTSPS